MTSSRSFEKPKFAITAGACRNLSEPRRTHCTGPSSISASPAWATSASVESKGRYASARLEYAISRIATKRIGCMLGSPLREVNRAIRSLVSVYCGGLGVHFDRVADRLPARMPAVHVPRIEACVAQLDRGLAAHMETVRALHDHRFCLRELADPLLELLGIAPRNALGDLLAARDGGLRAHVDD